MVHIGIIPDGNRRWCKKNGIPTSELKNHWLGLLGDIISCYDEEADEWLNNAVIMKPGPEAVTELTLYLCSIDNVRRGDCTMETITAFLNELLPVCCDWAGDVDCSLLRVNVIGTIAELEPSICECLKKLRKMFSSTNPVFTLNLALAYDYEMDACNHGVYSNDDYDTRAMSQIDLIFRTGGEKRISGFFPTKTYYSELFFLKKLWPEVTALDFAKTLRLFRKRKRRFCS